MYAHKIKYIIKNFLKTAIPSSIMVINLPNQSSRNVLITFDDGPCPNHTPQVLSVLRKYNCKAVFFVIGKKCKENPSIIDEIIRDGHVLANHSNTHIDTQRSGLFQYKNDIETCDRLLTELGVNSGLFRPPYGRLNLKSIFAARRLNLKIILMSNGGSEWNDKKPKNPKYLAESIIAKLKPNDIILMHDDHESIPEALDILLAHLVKRKFQYSFNEL